MKLGASQDTYGTGSDAVRSASTMTISSVMADIKEKFKNDEEDLGTMSRRSSLADVQSREFPSFLATILLSCIQVTLVVAVFCAWCICNRDSVAVPGPGQGHGVAGDQDLFRGQHGDTPPEKVLSTDHQAAAYLYTRRAVYQC